MQAGVVPATKGLDQVNQMINPDLPITLAKEQTRLELEDILAVSAAGWGGVDSHIVLGSPDQHLLKRTTTLIPATTFKRKSLKAPRLRSFTAAEKQKVPSLATGVFANCASDMFGVEIDADTDLKQHGLDSKSFTTLVGSAAEKLSGAPVG